MTPSTPLPEQGGDELRERVLAIDTVYVIGKNTTQQFLPPNFYIDRLVEFILADRKQHELELLDRLEAKKLEVQSAEEHLWYILDAIQAERERLGK